MRKIGFVILHYNGFETTINCIDSIFSLKGSQRIEVIIVDNCSPNHSGNKLKEKYKENENITVLLLDKNYGFSKANNIGYKYLVERNECEFVIVANNDILFIQQDLIEKLEEKYVDNPFYIAGPDVFSLLKEKHQSPMRNKPRTEYEMRRHIQKVKIKKLFLCIENALHWLWKMGKETKIYKLYRNLLHQNAMDIQYNDWMVQKENIVLHGSCVFFSSDFINTGEMPFCPETFFYCEEDILAHRCQKNGWKICYFPELQVNHLEGDTVTQKGYYKKMKFRYNNIIASGNIYLNYLRGTL